MEKSLIASMAAPCVRSARPARLARSIGRRRALRLLVAVASVILAAAWAPGAAPARAQDAGSVERIAPDSNEHVYVSGVPDTFDDLRATIDRVKRETGRDYRVIVVGDGPEGDRSAREVLDAILARWGREVPTGTSKTAFDPSQDVLVYVDVNKQRLAMHAPWSLETGSGLDPRTIETEIIGKAFQPLAQDGRVDAGLVALVNATESWVKERRDREVARREAIRVFRTRTLPLAVASLAGLGALGALAVQWSRPARRTREAREKLSDFKSEVVALSDLLDAEQERHRMLPHSDPDFLTPMEGRTRSAYDGVQSALHRYRERWLELMDVWEKADETIQAERTLGAAKAEEAIRMLDAAGAKPPLDDVARECRAPLDELEQAHEKARAMAGDLDGLITATGQRLEAIQKRGRSAASFRGPLAEVGHALELSRAELERDPLSARARMEEARGVLDTASGRIDLFDASDDRRRQAALQADDLEQRVQAKRAEGWLLTEPGADPSIHVDKARKHLEVAVQLLDAGEIEAATKHVEEAERGFAEGVALLESVVAAKARVAELLPGAITRLEALAGRRDATKRTLEHLAEAYAPGSWSDVADNPVKADEGLSRARAMIAEAQDAARPERQHYFRAMALVEEAVRQEDWVDGCQTAVGERRGELDALRASLPNRCTDVGQRIGTLARRLESQATDRVRANEQCREADRLVEVAKRGLAVQRPDLPKAGQVIDAAETAVVSAETLADDDERLARQAFNGIETADHELRKVAGWYAEGVKPDVRSGLAALENAKGLLTRQRYEDAIRAAAEAQRLSREALAEASDEAGRRRRARQMEMQRRQMEDSYVRMSRGAGPWVIQLPGGTFSGPDPWRTVQARPAAPQGGGQTSSGGWGSRTAEGGW